MFNKKRDLQRRQQQEAYEQQKRNAQVHKDTLLINSIVKNAIQQGMDKYVLCVERGYGRRVLEEAQQAAIIEAKNPYHKIELDDEKIRELVAKAITAEAPRLGLDPLLLYATKTEQMLTKDLAALEIFMFKKYVERNNDIPDWDRNLPDYINKMRAYAEGDKENMPMFQDPDFMTLYKKGADFRRAYTHLMQEDAKRKDSKPSDDQDDKPSQNKGPKL